MTKISVTCDRCGSEKKESNHWWQVYPSLTIAKALVIQPAGYGFEVDSHGFHPTPSDFCSQDCAGRYIDAWMSQQVADAKDIEQAPKNPLDGIPETGQA